MTPALMMLILINITRTSDPLVLSQDLSTRAQARAELLCEKKQWSHDGWEDSFKGLKYTDAGENLAKDFPNVFIAQKALEHSKTHYDNIVNKRYTHLGVGEACGIYVQLFSGNRV
jgi:uncharacterized protein YkwD